MPKRKMPVDPVAVLHIPVPDFGAEVEVPAPDLSAKEGPGEVEAPPMICSRCGERDPDPAGECPVTGM